MRFQASIWHDLFVGGRFLEKGGEFVKILHEIAKIVVIDGLGGEHDQVFGFEVDLSRELLYVLVFRCDRIG